MAARNSQRGVVDNLGALRCRRAHSQLPHTNCSVVIACRKYSHCRDQLHLLGLALMSDAKSGAGTRLLRLITPEEVESTRADPVDNKTLEQSRAIVDAVRSALLPSLMVCERLTGHAYREHGERKLLEYAHNFKDLQRGQP